MGKDAFLLSVIISGVISAVALPDTSDSLPNLATVHNNCWLEVREQPLPRKAIGRLGTPRLRACSQLRSVVFSPNGALLASSGRDGVTCLWAYPSGKLLSKLTGHRGPANCAAFSPDGNLMVTGGDDRTVCIWNLTLKRLICRLRGHTDSVISVTWSPNGNIVASSGADNTVRLWEVASRRQIRQLIGHESVVSSLEFSPRGMLLASSSWDRTVRLWDCARGKELSCLRHDGSIFTVAFAPDGKTVATGGLTNCVHIWRVETGQQLACLKGHQGSVRTIRYSANRKWLLSGSEDGKIICWDVGVGKARWQTAELSRIITSVSISPDGGKVVSTEFACRVIRVWDTSSGKERILSDGHQAPVRKICFLPAGNLLISCGATGKNKVWDIRKGKQTRKWGDRGSEVLAIGAQGRLAAVRKMGAVVAICDTITGQELGRVRGPQQFPPYVYSSAFSPDGKALAVGAVEKLKNGTVQASVRLHDVQTGKQLRQLGFSDDVVDYIVFSPSGRWLVSGERGKSPHLWNARTGKRSVKFLQRPDHVWSATFSSDGRNLVSIQEGKFLRFWQIATGKERCSFIGADGSVGAVAFSPNGRIVAIGGLDGTIRLWDCVLGKAVQMLRGHEGEITCLEFSVNGKVLASASDDTTIILWDVKITNRQ